LEPGTKPIATVKTVTKELWDNEDWETKRAVAEVVAKAEAVSIKPGEGSQRTPQQYQE
jgi:hypothetical protein